MRSIRDPYTKSWTRVLQQRFPAVDGEYSISKLVELNLNDAEYAVFERFEGREIRKNRYFHEFDNSAFIFDVYLGPLWGLNTARVDFESHQIMEDFVPPPFAVFEVTNNASFAGENLVEKNFGDIQAEVARLGSFTPPDPGSPDE